MFKETNEGKTQYCKACEEIARGMYVEKSLHNCGLYDTPVTESEQRLPDVSKTIEGKDFNPIGSSGSTNPVHLPPTGMNGRGEVVGCKCEKCLPHLPEEKDLVDWESEFDRVWKSTLITCFGYKTPDDGMQRKVVAEQGYSKLKQSIYEIVSSNTERVKKLAEGMKKEILNKIDAEDNKYWKANRNHDIGYNKALEDIIKKLK